MDKQHILDEIKRTTADNGGKPLGQSRFAKATGISSADWKQHWSVWGKAIQEAGLKPNELNKAYPDDVLLFKFVELTRALGKVPANSDLKFRANKKDPPFPSHNTFARLGSAAQRVQRVLEFCRAQGNYDDVIPIFDSWTPRLQQAASDALSNAPAIEIGSVYLMKSGRRYKFGRSNSVGRREYEVARQSPDPLKVVHEFKTDDPKGIEAYWLKRFKSKHHHGEWFNLTADDVRAFKRRKDFM